MQRRKFEMPVHIIGVGSVGSAIAYQIGKRGTKNLSEIHVWDGDVVSAENCRNQTFNPLHIGMPKVEAIARQLVEWGGVIAIEHHEYVTGPQDISGIVFLCVDGMQKRKVIWDACIKSRQSVMLMIETRTEMTNAHLYVVDPNNALHVRKWERYWYPDDQATTAGGCGVATALGPIADTAANMAVWQLVRYLERDAGYELYNRIRIDTGSMAMDAEQWT